MVIQLAKDCLFDAASRVRAGRLISCTSILSYRYTPHLPTEDSVEKPYGSCTSWRTLAKHFLPVEFVNSIQAVNASVGAQEANFTGYPAFNRELAAKTETVETQQRIALPLDTTGIPVYVQQKAGNLGAFWHRLAPPNWIDLGPIRQARPLSQASVGRQSPGATAVVVAKNGGWDKAMRAA